MTTMDLLMVPGFDQSRLIRKAGKASKRESAAKLQKMQKARQLASKRNVRLK